MVYIVLGVLYESYIHPITILSALPSAGFGALLMLMLLHYELSFIAIVGIILLIGIVKKNAIMMIDFALKAARIEGKAPQEAIHQACLLRFRPIMMTNLQRCSAHCPSLSAPVGRGIATAAWRRDHWRSPGVAMADAVPDAGHLSLPRTAVLLARPRLPAVASGGDPGADAAGDRTAGANDTWRRV